MRKSGLQSVFALVAAIAANGQIAPPTLEGLSAVPMPDANGVYEAGAGVSSPSISEPLPVIGSEELRASCTPKMVKLVAVITPDGTAMIRTIEPATGDPCSDAVVATMKQTQFQPGTLDNKRVPVAVCIRVPFQYLHPPVPHLVSCQDSVGFASMLPADDPFKLPPGAKPPKPIHTVEAEFSDEARRERIEGNVLISTIVDERGLPTQIRVLRGAGHGFDENAIAAVSQYRFQPATLDGKPIAARITIQIAFRLRN